MSRTRGAIAAAGNPLPGMGTATAVPVRHGWTGLYSLTNLGLNLGWLTAIQIQLPAQLAQVDPAGKEGSLALVFAVGAAVAMISNPLFGALSDRTRSGLGRRAPWVVGGAVAGAAGLVLIGTQHNVPGIVAGWGLAQFALGAPLAGMTAVLADRVPVRQRGWVSAWWGLMGALGPLVGALVVSVLFTGTLTGYLATAALVLATVLPFPFLIREQPGPAGKPDPFRWKSFAAGFWVPPRRFPDFAWAWGTRFLMTLATFMGTTYLLYYLRDELHYEQSGHSVQEGVFVLLGLFTAGTVTFAVLAGWLSDRLGKRRSIVCAAGMIMAAAAALLALSTSWEMIVVAAFVLGAGNGAYLAVGQALVTQVLPREEDAAKDLGIINIANTGPQVLAPVFAAPLVTYLGGYPVLYGVTAAIAVTGSALIWKVRGVP